jgi:hypothetical protein
MLMHQIRISTLQWYSGRKSWKSGKKIVKTVYEPKNPQIVCHEIEPNPSKDRAINDVQIVPFLYCFNNKYHVLKHPLFQFSGIWPITRMIVSFIQSKSVRFVYQSDVEYEFNNALIVIIIRKANTKSSVGQPEFPRKCG